jgi:hypothetical protein
MTKTAKQKIRWVYSYAPTVSITKTKGGEKARRVDAILRDLLAIGLQTNEIVTGVMDSYKKEYSREGRKATVSRSYVLLRLAALRKGK